MKTQSGWLFLTKNPPYWIHQVIFLFNTLICYSIFNLLLDRDKNEVPKLDEIVIHIIELILFELFIVWSDATMAWFTLQDLMILLHMISTPLYVLSLDRCWEIRLEDDEDPPHHHRRSANLSHQKEEHHQGFHGRICNTYSVSIM